MQVNQDHHSPSKNTFNPELTFKHFFELSPLMMGIADVEGDNIRHIADNEASASFFGMPSEKMTGKLASELGVAPETINLWVEHYRESEKSGLPVNFNFTHINENNDEQYFSVVVYYTGLSPEGNSRFSYIVRDITDQVLINNIKQEQLKSSEERFRAVVENMSEGLMIFDREGNLTYQNPASIRLHEKNPFHNESVKNPELVSFWRAWDLNGREIEFAEWPVSRVFKGESFKDQVLKVQRADEDKFFYASYNGCPILNEQKNIILGFITIRDITDQIMAEINVHESEERFKTIANALPQIIWTARPDGYVDWYNQWYFEYTGLTPETDWDMEKTSPIHPEDFENLKIQWSRSLQSGEPTYIEFRIKRNCDGVYRWHLSRGVPIRNEENKIIKWIGSNTDIHDQKILVEELENERELREKFVATLSHDLRTPLTAAKMNAQLLIRKPGDLEFSHRAKSKIIDNLDRADSMIRDLLDVNRIKAGEKLPLEYGACLLNSLISDIIDDLTTVHGDRFKFIHNDEIEGHWSCNGIRRILENLCNNAVKYGDPLYPITITSHADGNWVELKVHNYGNPIPKADQSKLFEPFRRADSAQKSSQRGWGLGLSLVRGLAEAHGGNVTVDSSEQKGTTFGVRLPK